MAVMKIGVLQEAAMIGAVSVRPGAHQENI
jgi:hypothetical protein